MSESHFDKRPNHNDGDPADGSDGTDGLIQPAVPFDIPDLHDMPAPYVAAPVRLPFGYTPGQDQGVGVSKEPLEYNDLTKIQSTPQTAPKPSTSKPNPEVPIDAIVIMPGTQPENTSSTRQAPEPVEPVLATPVPIIEVSYSDKKRLDRQSTKSGKMPPGRALGFWSTCAVMLAGFVVALAIMFVPISTYFTANHRSIATSNHYLQTNGSFFAWSNIAVVIPWAAFVSVFAIGRGTWRNPREDEITKGSMLSYLGFKRVHVIQFLFWGILVPVIFVAGLHWLSTKVPGDPSGEKFVSDILSHKSSLPLVIFVLLVVAPLFEEIIFRGFMYRGIEKSPLGPVGAILISSFFFTIVHLQYTGSAIIELFVLALLLGIVRARTGSIITTIAMHFVFNAGALFVYFVTVL